MRGIVGPGASSIQAADTAGVEIVPVNEAVVDHDTVAAPAETPTPSAPSAPAVIRAIRIVPFFNGAFIRLADAVVGIESIGIIRYAVAVRIAGGHANVPAGMGSGFDIFLRLIARHE